MTTQELNKLNKGDFIIPKKDIYDWFTKGRKYEIYQIYSNRTTEVNGKTVFTIEVLNNSKQIRPFASNLIVEYFDVEKPEESDREEWVEEHIDWEKEEFLKPSKFQIGDMVKFIKKYYSESHDLIDDQNEIWEYINQIGEVIDIDIDYENSVPINEVEFENGFTYWFYNNEIKLYKEEPEEPEESDREEWVQENKYNKMKTFEEFDMITEAVSDLNIDRINPQPKDIMRARNLRTARIPLKSAANSMSKLITDPLKLVRRSKAVVMEFGTDENAWRPFKRALELMGFTAYQISQISNTEDDDYETSNYEEWLEEGSNNTFSYGEEDYQRDLKVKCWDLVITKWLDDPTTRYRTISEIKQFLTSFLKRSVSQDEVRRLTSSLPAVILKCISRGENYRAIELIGDHYWELYNKIEFEMVPSGTYNQDSNTEEWIEEKNNNKSMKSFSEFVNEEYLMDGYDDKRALQLLTKLESGFDYMKFRTEKDTKGNLKYTYKIGNGEIEVKEVHGVYQLVMNSTIMHTTKEVIEQFKDFFYERYQRGK